MMFNRILDNSEINAAMDYIYKINPKLRSHYVFFSRDNKYELYTLVIDTTRKEYDRLIDYINRNK